MPLSRVVVLEPTRAPLPPPTQTPTLTTRPLRRHTTDSTPSTRKGPPSSSQTARVARRTHAGPLPSLANRALPTGSRACPHPTRARPKSRVGLPSPTRTFPTCSICSRCSTRPRFLLTWELASKATTIILSPPSRTRPPNRDLPSLLVSLPAMGNAATHLPSSRKRTMGPASTLRGLVVSSLQRPTSST
jgi:hypothetical protein